MLSGAHWPESGSNATGHDYSVIIAHLGTVKVRKLWISCSKLVILKFIAYLCGLFNKSLSTSSSRPLCVNCGKFFGKQLIINKKSVK